MTKISEARTDRYGFPIKPCTRCTGTGAFGPTSVHGGACFRCAGTGWETATKRASEARAAYLNARQKQRSVYTHDLVVGDQVAYQRAWRTIERIDLGAVCAWVERDGERVPVSYRTTFTFDSGEVVEWPSNVAHRRGGVDLHAYLVQAGVA